MYKQKDKKINSVNTSLQDEVNLDGNVMMKMIENESIEEKTQSDGKKIPRESWLMSDKLMKMKIEVEFLSKIEKQLFINILFEYKNVITFDDSKMKLLDSMIEFSIKIHTIPHQSWQQFNLQLLKAI